MATTMNEPMQAGINEVQANPTSFNDAVSTMCSHMPSVFSWNEMIDHWNDGLHRKNIWLSP